MAVGKTNKKLIPLRKGNEQRKVLEEFVPTMLEAGWKKVVVTKGKRDPKTNQLLKGEEDKVVLVGLETEDSVLIKELKAENAALKAKIATLTKV